MLIVDFLAEKKPPMWTALIVLFSDSYWQYIGGEVWRGGSLKKFAVPQRADFSPSVRLSFLPPLPLQVSVIKLQRLYDKIRFLPSGDGFRYELGYPLVLKGGLFFLVRLFLLHDALDNPIREFSLLHELFHLDSLCKRGRGIVVAHRF